MAAPAAKLVAQILDKYVVEEKLRSKLTEKFGTNFVIDVRFDDWLPQRYIQIAVL